MNADLFKWNRRQPLSPQDALAFFRLLHSLLSPHPSSIPPLLLSLFLSLLPDVAMADAGSSRLDVPDVNSIFNFEGICDE